MPPEPADTTSWLALAEADLALARRVDRTDQLQRGLGCYHCQQAAEKSLKAVLLDRGVSFPWTHNLSLLVQLLETEQGSALASEVRAARILTNYASAARYPDDLVGASEADLDEAIDLAERALGWARAALAA